MSCCSTCQNVTCQCSNGVNGKNIWTVTTALFVPPAPSASVQITVSSTQQLSNQGFGVGQVVYIENAGYYEVISIDSLTTMTVENLAGYGNPSPANVAPGAKVSPGGLIGPTGPAGTPAINGTTLLYNDNTPVVSIIGGSPSVLHSYTVAAGELVNNGDALKVKTVVKVTTPFSNQLIEISLRVNNNKVTVAAFPNALILGTKQIHIESLISRVSNTSLNVSCTLVAGAENPGLVPSGISGGAFQGTQFAFESVPVANIDLNTFDIDIYEIRVDANDVISSQYLTIEKLVI